MLIQYTRIRENARMPERASDGAVGYDVYASVVLDKETKKVLTDLPATLKAGESLLIGTGIRFAVPFGYEAQVRPRSGLANIYDVELSNSPGTVDPDFRGEAGILLRNRGKWDFIVEEGMRVAQLIFSKVELPVLQEITELPSTRRGSGGFGSTGLMEITGGLQESTAQQLRLDHYFMGIAIATAELSDCVRGMTAEDRTPKRKFGCVIVKNNSIISSGYNSFYPGQKECTPHACIRDTLATQSGSQVEMGGCYHAEWVAICRLTATGIGAATEGATVYVNAEPCIICAKLLTCINPQAVVIPEGVYPTNGTAILLDAGIAIRYIEMS